MSTPVPYTIKCDRYDDCNRRFDDLDARVEKLSERQIKQGESIASLRAQVAIWAAVGALAGGGLVSIAVNVLAKP